MEIRFVRTVGQRDRVYVRRTEGGETSWVFPTYGDLPPHDLVHLVVEAAFGVTDGFWARVDAGVDVARINAEANRRSGVDKYSAMGDQRGIFLAEGLAGAPWFDPEVPDPELRECIVRQCQRFNLEAPSGLTLERIGQVRTVLERLRLQWKALVPKGTLLLHFSLADLEGSFLAFSSPPV